MSRNSTGGTGVSAGGWGDAPLARALFAYLSSGENQLSFLEGDLIALMGKSDLAFFYRYDTLGIPELRRTYAMSQLSRNGQSAERGAPWVNDRARTT